MDKQKLIEAISVLKSDLSLHETGVTNILDTLSVLRPEEIHSVLPLKASSLVRASKYYQTVKAFIASLEHVLSLSSEPAFGKTLAVTLDSMIEANVKFFTLNIAPSTYGLSNFAQLDYDWSAQRLLSRHLSMVCKILGHEHNLLALFEF